MPNLFSAGAIVKTPTAFAIVLTTLSLAHQARAADAYTLKIEPSFEISANCATSSGAQQNSQITIMIDTSTPNADPKALTNAAAQIKVCSPFVAPINQTLPVPLPVALLKNAAQVPLNRPAKYPLQAALFKTAFKGSTAPNVLIATKLGADEFEFKYVDQASGAVIIGPVRAYLVPAAKMQSVPGFTAASNLPIDHVEIDVAAENVTLKADIVSVKSVTAKPTTTAAN